MTSNYAAKEKKSIIDEGRQGLRRACELIES